MALGDCRHSRLSQIPESDGGVIRFTQPDGPPYSAGTVSTCSDCGAVVVRFDAPPPGKGPFGCAFVLAGHDREATAVPGGDRKIPAAGVDPVGQLFAEAVARYPEFRDAVLRAALREAAKILNGKK